MASSQDSAVVAGLAQLGYDVPKSRSRCAR